MVGMSRLCDLLILVYEVVNLGVMIYICGGFDALSPKSDTQCGCPWGLGGPAVMWVLPLF